MQLIFVASNMLRRLILLLFSLSFINTQTALPPFQALHTPQNTSGTPENTLQSSGLSYDTRSVPWNYLFGFTFTPQVNGTITRLGGYYNGTKTVYLWWFSDGSYLGSVSNYASNTWTYTDLESSVSVVSGIEYFVGVAINGSWGARIYFSDGNLPYTYGNVTINKSYYERGSFSSTTMPTNWDGVNLQYTWVVPDITFVPN